MFFLIFVHVCRLKLKICVRSHFRMSALVYVVFR